jgi:hypothetical protein
MKAPEKKAVKKVRMATGGGSDSDDPMGRIPIAQSKTGQNEVMIKSAQFETEKQDMSTSYEPPVE